MQTSPDVTGAAALAICESLLLSLTDKKVLKRIEVIGVLTDAAGAHTNAVDDAENPAFHTAVAALITAIIDDGRAADPQ